MGIKVKRILIWLLIVLGVGIVLFVVARDEVPTIPKSSAFKAVFLSNGQVYFGKLAELPSGFFSLTEVYYLRAGTLQQAGEEGSTQIDLVKLGAEIHAPKDEMFINRDQVIFFEDIQENGEVMRLIRAHQATP